jgi:hypothetical protein
MPNTGPRHDLNAGSAAGSSSGPSFEDHIGFRPRISLEVSREVGYGRLFPRPGPTRRRRRNFDRCGDESASEHEVAQRGSEEPGVLGSKAVSPDRMARASHLSIHCVLQSGIIVREVGLARYGRTPREKGRPTHGVSPKPLTLRQLRLHHLVTGPKAK